MLFLCAKDARRSHHVRTKSRLVFHTWTVYVAFVKVLWWALTSAPCNGRVLHKFKVVCAKLNRSVDYSKACLNNPPTALTYSWSFESFARSQLPQKWPIPNALDLLKIKCSCCTLGKQINVATLKRGYYFLSRVSMLRVARFLAERWLATLTKWGYSRFVIDFSNCTTLFMKTSL